MKIDSDNKKIIIEERGFTERSLNLLLKKIIDDERKQEAQLQGIDAEELDKQDQKEEDQSQQNSLLPRKRPYPLIKTMYIRDPQRLLFKI